jgi:anti-sigma factor RsiW
MNQTHPSIEHIIDYLHGELAPAEDAAMHAHLAACRSCDERRAEEVALTETLRAHARAGELELPAAVITRIHHGVERRSASSAWERLRAGFRPIFVLPAAAAIAAAVYVGVDVWRGAATPTVVDAAYYVENHAAMAATTPFADDAPSSAMLTSDDETR